tara:strand:+ start:379 stop:546 length:168 start_codon:yes stop_codon:yes gene_type:complete
MEAKNQTEAFVDTYRSRQHNAIREDKVYDPKSPRKILPENILYTEKTPKLTNKEK